MPIKFPDFCYKSVSESSAMLSDIAIGPPNIPASLAEGHVRYEAPQEVNKKKPKIVIFNALKTAIELIDYNSDEYKRGQFFATLHQLLQEGFDVFIPVEPPEYLEPLEHCLISQFFLQSCTKICPSSTELIQQAQRLHLNGKHTYDDFLVLDDEKMIQLIESISKQPDAKNIAHLYEDDMSSDYNETYSFGVPEATETSKIIYQHIIDTHSVLSSTYTLADVDFINWRFAWLSSSLQDKEDWLLKSLSPRGIALLPRKSDAHPENQIYLHRLLPFTTSLMFFDNNKPLREDLITYLSNTPRLTTLKVYLTDITLTQVPIKSKLNELELKYCNAVTLKAFLSATPQLKELTLEQAELIGIENTMKQLHALPKIQKLSLSNSAIILTEQEQTYWGRDFPEFNYPLPQLQYLEIHITQGDLCTIYLVTAIINNAPNLNSIDLTHCSDSSFINLLLPRISNFLQKKPHEILLPNDCLSFHDEGEKSDQDIDADTSPKEVTFTPKTLFQGLTCENPPPNNYRLRVTSDCTINPNLCPINKAFSIHYPDPSASLREAKIQPLSTKEMQEKLITQSTLETQDKFYHGQMKLRLTTNWQPLPSLKPYDEMIYHSLTNATGALINHLVEIKYSETDNMYYIHVKENIPITIDASIDYIIKQDYTRITKDHVAYDLYVDDLSRVFNSFSENKPLDMHGKTAALGRDYAEAIIAQYTGACRHRAMACIYWMRKTPSAYNVRYVKNEVHAYVEIKPPGSDWITVDLGGTTQGVTIIPTPFGVEERKISFNRLYFTQTKHSTYDDTEEYCSDLLQQKGNCFIETLSLEEAIKMSFLLQEKAQREGYSCFVVNSPDELTCPATSIRLIDDQLNAELVRQHGGPFYQFLTSESVTPRLLIINFEKFSASDKVRCNSAFDKKPQVDGIPFPLNTQVVVIGGGLDADSSLSSRFSRHEMYIPDCVRRFELPSLFIQDEISPDVLASTSSLDTIIKGKREDFIVDLYASSNHWKKRLLGEWHLHGSNLSYVKGPLIRALEQGITHITLVNPPVDNSEYQQFWQQLLLTKKLSYCNGLVEVQMPEGFGITECIQETFTQEMMAVIRQLIRNGIPPGENKVLNPTSFRTFFYRDIIKNSDQSLYQEAGILLGNRDKSFSIYVSDELSLENWREFLITCQQQGITIDLFLAPNIDLTIFLQQHPVAQQLALLVESTKPLFSTSDYSQLKHEVSFIQSSDRDVTLKQLEAIRLSRLSIDISELEANDLLEHVSGLLDNKASPPKFSFHQRKGALLEALGQDKTVILHGKLSKPLQHALTTWFIEEMKQTLSKGQLILISEEDQNPFIGLPCVPTFSHRVTPEEKKMLLPIPSSPGKYEHYDWSMPLTNLLAICQSETSDPWAGMRSLPSLYNAYQREIIETDLSEEQANKFIKKRESDVEKVLARSPYVFLAGVSGVGKTTFVRDYFKDSKGTLYEGEDNIRQWAESTKPGRKILFIDEANITSREWSEFEDLFSTSPCIVIDGLGIPLKPEHQVIFAGNPVFYSEDRHQPLLFERHGNSVVFEPLSLVFIFQRVLKPALEQMGIHDRVIQQAISMPILHAASFLTQHSVDTILITPRELETIALLTAMRCHPPETRFNEIAKHYVSVISKTFVPSVYLQTFDDMFPTLPELFPIIPSTSDFTFTPTNSEAGHIINDFLALRDRRQRFCNTTATSSSSDVSSPLVTPVVVQGLGGVIIEGEPGIGKSKLAQTILEERGLHAPFQGNWSVANPEAKMYYHVVSTMSLNDKEELLRKAFDEGAVVIWDEMNSSSSMERLLNSLLMGKTPEGLLPKKPGFFLISTQNPASMPGRHDTSVAIQHRMHYRVLPIYPDEEAAIVLRNIGWVPMEISKAIIEEKKKANKEGDSLSFRDAVKASYEAARKDPHGKKTLQVAEQEIREEMNAVYQKEHEHLFQEMIAKQPRNLFFSSSSESRVPVCEICESSPTSLSKPGSLQGEFMRLRKENAEQEAQIQQLQQKLSETDINVRTQKKPSQ